MRIAHYLRQICFATFLSSITLMPHAGFAENQVRLRDIVTIEGVRGNQLVGYGLVIGLQTTGDTLRNSPFTQQALAAMLERMGINVADVRVQTRNTAAVVVTATLPPFARQGTPVDVTVSSMGDAKSLNGGTLVVTPLYGADGEVYAVAQGPVLIGGFEASGQAASVSSGVRTSGRVPSGGIVEREVANRVPAQTSIRLALRNPDFSTAVRIEEAINKRIGANSARAQDLGTVEVNIPGQYVGRIPALMADLERLTINAEVPARIVIDERSGTIVVGEDVRINTVAISHGNLVIRVTETPQVSQPNALANGETTVVPRTDIQVDDQKGREMRIMSRNPTLRDLVNGLNALGLGPKDLMQVINTLKAAGAIQAEVRFI